MSLWELLLNEDEPMVAFLHNQLLLTAFSACFLAQGLKLVVEFAQHGTLNWKVLVETGGMPSSHSALVAALATGVGQSMGWDSNEFALATVFAIIVMYDASGIRWAAGQQAKMINQLNANRSEAEPLETKPLKELLGHTRWEVFVGACVGVAISLILTTVLDARSLGIG